MWRIGSTLPTVCAVRINGAPRHDRTATPRCDPQPAGACLCAGATAEIRAMSKQLPGRTSGQMRDAPAGAVFVWCTSHTAYPHALARHLGREDLLIMPSSWLASNRVRGVSLPVVLDHALAASHAYQDALSWLRQRNLLVGWLCPPPSQTRSHASEHKPAACPPPREAS